MISRRIGSVFLSLSLVMVVAACGSDASDDEPSITSTHNAEETSSPASALVGTWERRTKCGELVKAFQQARLDKWIPEFVAGNNFVPGVTDVSELKDPANPCRGSVPRTHSHFFTDDGSFGSLDFDGEQVDDGTYEITGPDTFAVSKEFPEPVTFHYEIVGDRITFDPVIPDCIPKCFEAAWSVVVAYPGKEWHRAA
jgi:hypothetical protein